MSDEEDDYMSNDFIQRLEQEDVRPGLVFSSKTARQNQLEKRKADADAAAAAEKRLKPSTDQIKHAKPLDTSNIGFSLLAKMGYKQGTGLGKQGEGIKEPISVDVKQDRSGLGTETVRREKKDKAQKILNEVRHMRSQAMQAQRHQFRAEKKSQFLDRKLAGILSNSQKVCFKLDKEHGVERPLEPFYWPQSELEEEKNDEDDEDCRVSQGHDEWNCKDVDEDFDFDESNTRAMSSRADAPVTSLQFQTLSHQASKALDRQEDHVHLIKKAVHSQEVYNYQLRDATVSLYKNFETLKKKNTDYKKYVAMLEKQHKMLTARLMKLNERHRNRESQTMRELMEASKKRDELVSDMRGLQQKYIDLEKRYDEYYKMRMDLNQEIENKTQRADELLSKDKDIAGQNKKLRQVLNIEKEAVRLVERDEFRRLDQLSLIDPIYAEYLRRRWAIEGNRNLYEWELSKFSDFFPALGDPALSMSEEKRHVYDRLRIVEPLEEKLLADKSSDSLGAAREPYAPSPKTARTTRNPPLTARPSQPPSRIPVKSRNTNQLTSPEAA